MPKLDKQRARTDADKALRRTGIVESARRLLLEEDWADLRIEDVAKGAHVAKASVFRYFATKEELVLAVYLVELQRLFLQLPPRLLEERPRGGASVARALARMLTGSPLFVRLSSALHAVLRSVSQVSARAFKLELLAQTSAAGDALEAMVPTLPAGAGVRLLVRFHAALIGLWQMADHAPAVAAAVAEGGLDPLCIDFAKETELVFVALLKDVEESS